ncbi:MAG: UDP-N-acetylmuramoyl-tripeptide--D-alanyl-D-alanine ligase [Candidatus Omnitrophota bacterium]|nr:UDP-N-acetylmuramoyl-tripeptide--D-alanyl-D-alanine ligase [Candidatus Omnitrophota bacterium]MBU2528763.1 UDP-N-acetylmuramoyl-tripeptide--D-alanyl-D-alanine ligase [bacterium]MBU3929123.1 UDP-N-acetylmuramoyl-tripeptide--D-alanyl-D-alanine ligase [bacterium]MBU4123114.1 UDP-N-acetylmuramoyl-tripeptide--D-alanyl-D-alanine ligase [bacterium]
MISLSIKEIIEATGGKLISGKDSVKITGVSIDSRRLRRYDIFFALKGSRLDGHRFAAEALKKCPAAIVEKAPLAKSGKSVILVKDSLSALKKTAELWRTKIEPRVIAVSGSNGKTSTKDLLAHILKKRFRVNAAEKSFNNFIGLPLTVLSTPRSADIMITEMETNVIGGIRSLCEIARPDTGIITNISDSHLSDLKTRENVFREKSELAEYISPGGSLILNNDDPFAAKFKKIFRGKLITYSLKKKSLCQVKIIKTGFSGTEFILHGKRFKTSLPGAFNTLNIAAAAAVARIFGIPWKTIIESVKTFKAPPGRISVKKIKGRILVNDSFNANPGSAKALAELLKNEKGRKAIVFADMLELGKDSSRLHAGTGADFAASGVESVHYMGRFGGSFIKGLKKINPAIKYTIHTDRKKLMAAVVKEPADLIAFKASRAMKIDEIFDHVVKHIPSRNH